MNINCHRGAQENNSYLSPGVTSFYQYATELPDVPSTGLGPKNTAVRKTQVPVLLELTLYLGETNENINK